MKQTSKQIMVSVIVPTYNHENYIRQALDGILMQNVDFKYEILAGDDGSTDATPEILRGYKQAYPDIFRLFLSEKNVGATKTSYNLLTNAKGKYLATCEGDDYWTDPEKLQIQVNFLEQNPEYVGVSHKFTVVDETGQALRNQRLNWVKDRERFRFQDFQGLFLPGQPSTFVRRNIFLDPEGSFHEIYQLHPMIADRTLMLLFLTKGDFYTLDRVMSCYRKSRSSGSSVTVRMYHQNTDRTEMDYELNIKLEKFAQKLLGEYVSFSERRATLFAEAVISFFRQQNRESWLLLKRMLKESDKPFSLILLVPYCVLRKSIQKLKR